MRGGKDDLAAVAAVAAVRSAAGDEHLTPETADAVAAPTGFDRDLNFVDKHFRTPDCTGSTASMQYSAPVRSDETNG